MLFCSPGVMLGADFDPFFSPFLAPGRAFFFFFSFPCRDSDQSVSGTRLPPPLLFICWRGLSAFFPVLRWRRNRRGIILARFSFFLSGTTASILLTGLVPMMLRSAASFFFSSRHTRAATPPSPPSRAKVLASSDADASPFSFLSFFFFFFGKLAGPFSISSLPGFGSRSPRTSPSDKGGFFFFSREGRDTSFFFPQGLDFSAGPSLIENRIPFFLSFLSTGGSDFGPPSLFSTCARRQALSCIVQIVFFFPPLLASNKVIPLGSTRRFSPPWPPWSRTHKDSFVVLLFLHCRD